MNNLTKENILDRVSDHQIFNHFLSEYNGGKQLKEGVHIPNPIVLKNEGRRQKTPSFNITYYNGKWFFKDFAEEWCHGDVFEFIQMLYKTDFKGALQVINDSMGLMLNGDGEVRNVGGITRTRAVDKYEKEKIYDYSIMEKGFDSFEMGFWRQYGDARQSDLDFYGIRALKWYANYSNKQEKWYEVYRKPGEPIFYYDHGDWGEVYMPYSRRKWDVLGKREKGFLFGYDQLPKSGVTLDLTGGQKDVFTLYIHGFAAVSMNSESSNPNKYPKLMGLLNGNRFKVKRVLYDNDKAGLKNAIRIAEEHGLINITELLPQGYDISDYYKQLIKKQKR